MRRSVAGLTFIRSWPLPRLRHNAKISAIMTSIQTIEQTTTINRISCLRLIADVPCTSSADCQPVQPSNVSSVANANPMPANLRIMDSDLGPDGPELVPHRTAWQPARDFRQ